MNNSFHIREQLKQLSRSLAPIHKLLMNFQKKIFEDLEERQLSPHDLLSLVLSHPDFEWLKTISTIMVQIDEAVDDKDANLEKFQKEITSELRKIFIEPSEYKSFKDRIMIALGQDSHLFILLGDLRKQIALPKH